MKGGAPVSLLWRAWSNGMVFFGHCRQTYRVKAAGRSGNPEGWNVRLENSD
jgi:hypothetical protein